MEITTLSIAMVGTYSYTGNYSIYWNVGHIEVTTLSTVMMGIVGYLDVSTLPIAMLGILCDLQRSRTTMILQHHSVNFRGQTFLKLLSS